MTREEAIKILKIERGYFCDFKGSQEQQAFTMAIKALEQEPVLDKIRAEIEQVSFTHYFEYGEYYGEDTRQERIVNFDAVMRIIDKYKAESEG